MSSINIDNQAHICTVESNDTDDIYMPKKGKEFNFLLSSLTFQNNKNVEGKEDSKLKPFTI